MPNRFYPYGLNLFLTGKVDYLTNDFRIVLVNRSEYEPDFDNDRFLHHIPADGRVAISGPFQNKRAVAGTAYSDAKVQWGSVWGNPIDAIVVFKYVFGQDSPLIAWVDDAEGLPIHPIGQPIEVAWNELGVFTL